MLVDRISLPNKATDPAHRLSRRIAGSVLGPQLTVEFIGSFILVLTVGLSTSSKGAGDLSPLAIGSALMVVVFAGGHISGAHYNPAVSFAALLAGKLRPRQTASYILTELAAGVLAAHRRAHLHARARIRRTQRHVRRGHRGKLLLRAGDRVHGRHGDLRRGQNNGRSVQPRRRLRWRCHRSADLEPAMDRHSRQRSRRSCRGRPIRLPMRTPRGR
jgi:glycerol uptake facilitator-like aquaporin